MIRVQSDYVTTPRLKLGKFTKLHLKCMCGVYSLQLLLRKIVLSSSQLPCETQASVLVQCPSSLLALKCPLHNINKLKWVYIGKSKCLYLAESCQVVSNTVKNVSLVLDSNLYSFPKQFLHHRSHAISHQNACLQQAVNEWSAA